MKYTLLLADNSHTDYIVEQSPRAKYLRIKISPAGEVKVVVPRRVNLKHAHDFIADRKDWVYKHLQTIKDNPPPEIVNPDQLHLHLLNEHWQIEYETSEEQGVVLSVVPERRLIIAGHVDNRDLVFSVLEKWLKAKAKMVFPVMLDDVAEQFGFSYNRLAVRGQKTRWGSCSAKLNINLNYKLLFFPEHVVRYVMIHELCHTREMNHSRRFWELVEQCDPQFQQHRQLLKDTLQFVPIGL